MCRGLKHVFVLEYLLTHGDKALSCNFRKMQRHSQFMKLGLNTRSTDGCVFAEMRDLVSGTDQERVQDRAFFYPSSEIEMFDV